MARPDVSTRELSLGRGFPTRLWPLTVGTLAGGIFAALEGAPDAVLLFALGAAATLTLLEAALRRVERSLRVDSEHLVLAVRFGPVTWDVARIERPEFTEVSAVCVGTPGSHPYRWLMSVRVVGATGRLAWRVLGQAVAEHEAERSRELLASAGIRPAPARARLQGSITVRSRGERLRFSWPAGAPRSRLATVLPALVPAVLVLGLISGTSSAQAALGAAVAAVVGLCTLALAAVRAHLRRAVVEVHRGTWRFARQGLFRTRALRGGGVALPGRVVSLRDRHLSPYRELALHDGSSVAGPDELTEAEMRWLVAEVAEQTKSAERAA